MAARWFERVKMCVTWNGKDRNQIAELRRCLDSDGTELAKGLGRQLLQLKELESSLNNEHFTRRLNGVIREWLVGLLEGGFEETYAEERRRLGEKLAQVDLTFKDVILLEWLARQRLFELARERLDEQPEALVLTLHTLDKALNLDLALLYEGLLEVRDAEMKREMLDRFLTVTGFSRTLYESLAETRGLSLTG